MGKGLAGRRQLPQETDPDADRLLGLGVEAVVPAGAFEPGEEHGVAAEHQPVAARLQADDAVPGGVAAGATGDHPRRHLVFRLERPQQAAVLVQEPRGDRPKRVRNPWRHGGAGQIGPRRPELGLGGRHVDPQVRPQPALHRRRAARQCGPCAGG